MKLTFFKRLSMAAAMMTVLPLMGHVNNIQAGIVFMKSDFTLPYGISLEMDEGNIIE